MVASFLFSEHQFTEEHLPPFIGPELGSNHKPALAGSKSAGRRHDHHALVWINLDTSTLPPRSSASYHHDSYQSPSELFPRIGDDGTGEAVRWIDALQEAISVLDANGVVREWNRAMVYLSGIEKDDATSRKFFELLPSDFEKNLAAPIRQAFSGTHSIDGEFFQFYAEEILFSFRYKISRIDDLCGQGLVIVSLIDKSDRDRLARKLKKQEQYSKCGMLSSRRAYDLTEPIDAICSTIDKMLAANAAPGNDDLEKGLHEILDELYRINRLSNNFAAVARDHSPSFMCLNLNAVIREAVAAQEENFNRSPLCNLRLANGPVPMVGDPFLLRCMLDILLKSAIKAAGDDAVPLVETSVADERSIFIRIEDRGLAHTVAKAQTLDTCVRIVEAHKGTLKAETRAGRGIVYTITLPRATDFLSGEGKG